MIAPEKRANNNWRFSNSKIDDKLGDSWNGEITAKPIIRGCVAVPESVPESFQKSYHRPLGERIESHCPVWPKERSKSIVPLTLFPTPKILIPAPILSFLRLPFFFIFCCPMFNLFPLSFYRSDSLCSLSAAQSFGCHFRRAGQWTKALPKTVKCPFEWEFTQKHLKLSKVYFRHSG